MKTVSDAVKEKNGEWRMGDGFNRMAWLWGVIDYVWLDESTGLLYPEDGHIHQLGEDWQIVCTREEFEAEADRLGYGNTNICGDGSQCTDGEYCNDCPNKHNPVTSPAHYTSGNIECIDAIREALTPEEFRGFCKGNVIKYSWRERGKGGDEDLKKAAWYASKAVDNG